ncbi:MAG: HD domain-containing protein [Clostridia bacterium]|nr:HD domain-containing protein [Clostridia bacterium]
MKSFRLKMTIMIALAVLVITGLLSVISYVRARNTMASQLEENYSVVADKYAQELTAWLNSQGTVIDTLAVEITMSRIYESGYDAFHSYLEKYLAAINTNGYMYDIYFTYPDNSMACASDFTPDPEMDYVNVRDWYKIPAKTGQLFYSTPYRDSDSGYSIITISKAVYKDGVLQGIIAVDIFVNTVIDIVSGADVAGNGYAFLVDQNMGMIVHPYAAYVYDDTPIGIMDIPDSPYADIVANIISDSKGTVYLKDYDGVMRGIVISKMENTGWHVGIATDRDELLKSVSGLLRGFLIAAVVAVLIGLCIAVFMANMLNKLNIQLREQENLKRAKITNMNVTRSLASTIDAKDRYTSGHSQRVAEYAVEIARRLKKSEEEQQMVYYSGILHDVGKIRVPEDVINKPGKLTAEEFDQIRIHPTSGYHILRDIHEDKRVCYGAKYHHERYDGKGYPNGLKGNAIPEIARIIAVADAYDAMTSDRSYREALPQEVVREEILKGRGTQFDPRIADIMLEMIADDKDYSLRQKEEKIHSVLVVDNDETVISTLKSFMSDVNELEIIGVSGTEEALNLLAENEFSLAVIDLRMAETEGSAMLRTVRSEKDIPVILMTDDRDPETIGRVMEMDVDDYLTKPLNGSITKETIHSILHRSRQKL